MRKQKILVPTEVIENKILLIRGKKVMLDRDLAGLYGVLNKSLNQAVKRNIRRFPADFMFQLSKRELGNLKSQFVTSSWGGIRKLPYVFTEHGILMLSSVLNSERAVQVNIQIMRAFTKLREVMMTHKDLRRKIKDIIIRQETKFKNYDKQIQYIFKVINEILNPVIPEPPKKKYGLLANRED